MRVLHVSQPTEAGVPNVLLDVVRDQVARGWTVAVACPTSSGYLAGRARECGATVHEWEARRSPGPSVLGEVLALRQVVSRCRPDVVFLHASKAGLVGRLVLRGSLPTIVMPHSWSFEAATGVVARLSRAWEQLGSRWTTITLCVSEREREEGRRARCLGPRAAVVHNGVDLEAWSPARREEARAALGLPQDRPLVVTVGRLARQKGQDLLLQAWPGVVSQVPQAHLVLVGDGPDRGDLEARSLPSVSLVGAQDPHAWFAAADVVVIPSRWEGMALVLLEAMASGRSVVSTEVAGAREALGATDAVVPIDADALVEPLVGRLHDARLRRSEERRNREIAEERFDIRRSQQQVADLVLEATR